MRRVRTKDTAPELALRKALYAEGVRGWRVAWKGAPGKPDIAWPGLKIAVFVDGAFWHGHPDYYWGQSGEFWDEKIKRNRERDERNNAALRAEGWLVRRFWDFEIARDPAGCAKEIAALLSCRPHDKRT